MAAPVTKRRILSEVARLFDPLGWMAPVLVWAKVLLQDLWLLGVDWDAPVSPAVQAEWLAFRDHLPQLEAIAIPRWMGTTMTSPTLEIHAFCDASERAYCGVVYIRSPGQQGGFQTRLVIAKSKVAPVKTVSVPRLELNGALLLARLVTLLTAGLSPRVFTVHAWTDSAVTLAWIRSHASRWKPFITNRVAEIQTTLPAAEWNHIATASNPADLATRGISPERLSSNQLWWHGPPWLSRPRECWPASSGDPGGAELTEERGPVVCVALRSLETDPLLYRYSSLTRLLRVTALCRRFLRNLRRPAQRAVGPLTSTELQDALRLWVRLEQEQEYGTDRAIVLKGGPLSSSSGLRALAPFLGPHGILRVGGRLQGSFLPFDEKHPMIVSRRSPLARLLVSDAHHATLHGGVQLTRSHLVRRFWIPQGATLVRQIIHACVRCARVRGATGTTLMGPLPADRVRPSRPFLHSGVDYAGPVQVRTTKGRGHKSTKGYICLFVCLASKAIHLEAVSDLTAVAFLAAFRRFVSRRGRCASMLSDNGTTFRGADSELRAMFRAASTFSEEIARRLAEDGTEWAFIPPRAPHFGGLWEAGVKSVKYHLRRILGDHTLTYEELSTVLCQVEACLNSRPLYPLSEDPSDLAALTPGHLLVGETLTAVPEVDTTTLPLAASSRWVLTTSMRDHFWRRWSKEYVHHLQTRSKWTKPSPNLRPGSMVLLTDENLPPTKWALGRVTAVHPGPDGVVRVVTVRTATNTLQRAITKLALLPVPV